MIFDKVIFDEHFFQMLKANREVVSEASVPRFVFETEVSVLRFDEERAAHKLTQVGKPFDGSLVLVIDTLQALASIDQRPDENSTLFKWAYNRTDKPDS
jgi:hypothetical protein